MKSKNAGQKILLFIIGIYLLFPLFITFVYSIFTEWSGILPSGLTFQNYLQLLSSSEFWISLLRSVLISIVPIVICTFIILLAMYTVILYLPGFDKIMKILCTIPYAIQGVVLPISVLSLYADAPAPFSNRIFMLVSTYCIVVLPYMYQGIRNSLFAIQAPKLVEAAQMLGASRFYAFFRIIVPNVIGGVKVSAMLSLAIVFGDFTIINTLAGNYYPTAQMYMYEIMKKSGQKTSAIIILLFLVTLLISSSVFINKKRGDKGEED